MPGENDASEDHRGLPKGRLNQQLHTRKMLAVRNVVDRQRVCVSGHRLVPPDLLVTPIIRPFPVRDRGRQISSGDALRLHRVTGQDEKQPERFKNQL